MLENLRSRVWFVAVAVALVPGCLSSPGQVATKPTPPPASLSPSSGPSCPFTGEPLTQSSLGARVPVAVVVERKGAGLDAADIVFEEPVEGGQTWLLAMFGCGDAERVGPVRSAHVADALIVGSLGRAAFSASDARKEVRDVIGTAGGVRILDSVTHGSLFFRDPSRQAPDNLYTSTARLRSAAGPRPPGAGSSLPFDAPFSPTPPSPGAKAQEVSFLVGGKAASYTYEPDTGTYARTLDGIPQYSESGWRIHATNVVILWAEVKESDLRDEAGSLSPDVALVGSGDLLVVEHGSEHAGRWERPGPSSPPRFVDPAGQPIALAPGTTWVHLVAKEVPAHVR